MTIVLVRRPFWWISSSFCARLTFQSAFPPSRSRRTKQYHAVRAVSSLQATTAGPLCIIMGRRSGPIQLQYAQLQVLTFHWQYRWMELNVMHWSGIHISICVTWAFLEMHSHDETIEACVKRTLPGLKILYYCKSRQNSLIEFLHYIQYLATDREPHRSVWDERSLRS